MAVSHMGWLLCTVSNDKCGKVFDIINFDMINMFRFGFEPECCEWIHRSGDALQALAVAEKNTTKIHIYDGKGASTPIHTVERVHMKPVTVMKYNPVFDVMLSSDEGGMLEYWSGPKGDYASFPKNVKFDSKLDTDLFEFAKNKTYPLNIDVSPDGKQFVVFAEDKKIRVFK